MLIDQNPSLTSSHLAHCSSHPRLRARLRATWVVLVACILVDANCLTAHEPFDVRRQIESRLGEGSRSIAATERSKSHLRFFKNLITQWPTPFQEGLITQAWREHQFINGMPDAPKAEQVASFRQSLLQDLFRTLPSIHVNWSETGAEQRDNVDSPSFCRTIESPLLVVIHNASTNPSRLKLTPLPQRGVKQAGTREFTIPPGEMVVALTSILIESQIKSSTITLAFENSEASRVSHLDIPIKLTEPATILGKVFDGEEITPARITVQCSDGVCRYGGEFATESTFTYKPIIYPPIGSWQRTTFFYTNGEFEIQVPPGDTRVVAERGFEHNRSMTSVQAKASKRHSVELACSRMEIEGLEDWVSGDNHVHWVTNQWNVDEPLDTLAMVQRAEGLQVANNLTLLQRHANEAFIKPSQAPMGPISEFSDLEYHIQMGEEYRNENLYGHLCFLNIDWLVQPIGTGSIIAGPDALDYPLNRTAIESCRAQGGISIEAHGTGGNKNVPVNVIHNLTDSLDQMEPESYYHLLDCGFRLPLTNGSDHPARTLGIARSFVKMARPFTYDRWIEAIRRGKTFTTSGPMIFLTVNGDHVGSVQECNEDKSIDIVARFVSRDPIGTMQIISNGNVIAEKETDLVDATMRLSMTAKESRWIVARCSRRSDGRADFGFGNFNAITGPGIAHTSPIYINVAGRPRFEPLAASYWQGRIRQHIGEVDTTGRFATRSQRQEAVKYLQEGLEMFAQLESDIDSARSRSESWMVARSRFANVIRRFGGDKRSKDVLEKLSQATNEGEFKYALQPLIALRVSVNPESRVKVDAITPELSLREGRPQRFLVEVENTAGITAPLNLTAIDITQSPPGPASWCSIDIVDSPFTSRFFSGALKEYKVIEIIPHTSGLKEVRVVGDAGQGTQDLGFRATTDLMLKIEPKGSTQ